METPIDSLSFACLLSLGSLVNLSLVVCEETKGRTETWPPTYRFAIFILVTLAKRYTAAVSVLSFFFLIHFQRHFPVDCELLCLWKWKKKETIDWLSGGCLGFLFSFSIFKVVIFFLVLSVQWWRQKILCEPIVGLWSSLSFQWHFYNLWSQHVKEIYF